MLGNLRHVAAKLVNSGAEAALGRERTDSLKSEAIRRALQAQLNGIGEVMTVQLDTAEKKFSAEFSLLDEIDKLVVYVDQYSVEADDREAFIVVHQARISKRWMQHLLPNFLPYRVPLPAEYSYLVEAL